MNRKTEAGRRMADCAHQLYNMIRSADTDKTKAKRLMAEIWQYAKDHFEGTERARGHTRFIPETQWNIYVFGENMDLFLKHIDNPEVGWVTYQAIFMTSNGCRYNCEIEDFGMGEPVFSITQK